MAYRAVRIWGLVLGLMVALSGCSGMHGQVASGKVVEVGKAHLILKDAHSVMFVTLQESDREHLKSLVRKGDEVTLIGTTPTGGEGGHGASSEINAVVLSDGTRISLGQ